MENLMKNDNIDNINERTGRSKHQPNSLLSAQPLPRPRIDRALEQAMENKLIYVVAGAGYGKTQGVLNYVKKQTDGIICWMQLTESDNIGSSFWENFSRNISLSNQMLGERVREFGFPETISRFKQFTELTKNAEKHLSESERAGKRILVLDDFHLIYSKRTLSFLERCIGWEDSGLNIVIISRCNPELESVDTITSLAKGELSVITEEELRYTKEELGEFLKYRNIPFTPEQLPLFLEGTKGWALAIQLLSLVLQRIPGNLELALSTMKQNVFKLLETEAFKDYPLSTQKTMIRLALVSDFPQMPLEKILEDESIIQNTQLGSFVWFDTLAKEYRIHPLFLEFLKEKHLLLTDEEKKETYYQVATWCFENDYYMNAMNYFAKAHQFGRMIELIMSYPFKLPYDTCKYFLEIIEGIDYYKEESAPNYEDSNEISLLLLNSIFAPLLLVGIGEYEVARESTLDVINQWEGVESPFAFSLLSNCYSNLAYFDMYTCTVSHKYDSPKNLKKSVEYFKKLATPPEKTEGPFAVVDIRSFACLVGIGAKLEEFDQFLEASRQTAQYIEETYHDMYYGYEDLVASEIAYYKNQLDKSKNYAHKAILKAREKKQYSIEAMAEGYLLEIAMAEGDYYLAKEIIKQLEKHLDNPIFWNRQSFYDLATGNFYAGIGYPRRVPSWLIMSEKEATDIVRTPTEELIVSVKTYIALEKYSLALTVLYNSYPRVPQEGFLFGELIISLLTAVVKIKSGDQKGAISDFKKAYALSYEGVFEMPFIECGRNLHQLINAVLKDKDCDIPVEWLNKMDRKASVYWKKTNIILETFKRDNNILETVNLSKREIEVLKDLYHGLSREEIAEHRYLSVNTVKKILQSIYIKLDANNNVNAIRIASEMNLLD
jgi:LuxR family maltose regulon positive regulatory protein